jgi:hypothetical protein
VLPCSARNRDQKPFHFYEPLEVDVSSMNLEVQKRDETKGEEKKSA